MVVEFGCSDLSPLAPLREERQSIGTVLHRTILETLNEYTLLGRVVEDLEDGSLFCHSLGHGLSGTRGGSEFRSEKVSQLLVV